MRLTGVELPAIPYNLLPVGKMRIRWLALYHYVATGEVAPRRDG